MIDSHLAALKVGTAAMALGAGVVFSATAVAQETSGPSYAAKTQVAAEAVMTQATDEIIVTARRRDERLLDAPVAVSAVSGATLNQLAVSRVTDMATLVPSLIAGRAASGSSASIFLRGVGSTALSAGFDQSVSFVIDGIAMSRGREISLPQFDIQRVEVLKGPQALFFGKNTTGGLISVVSNGATDTLQAGAKGGYGFKAKERYVEAYVSGPLTDTLKARIAGRYSKSDGAFVNTAADSFTNYIPGQFRTRTNDRRGGAETYGVRGTLDWDATPNFNVQLKGGISSVYDGGPTDLIERICGGGRTTPLSANGLPPSPNADCVVNGRSDQSSIPVQVANANYRYARDGKMYADFKSQYGALTAHLNSDPFDVTSITGYYRFKQTDLNNVSGEGYPAGFSQLAEFKQFSQELRFQSKFDGPVNILFGAYYAHGDFTFNTDAYIFPVPLDTVNNTYVTFKRDNGFKSDSLSGFGELTWNLSSKLELAGGARWSYESRESYQRSLPAHIAFAGAFPGGISISDRYSATNLSPQITIRYKPEDDTSLYAAYKQGFKPGGYNISQSLTPAATAATGRYQAETAEGGEVGLRTLQFERHLSLNLTVYQYTYSSLQVQFFDPVTISNVAGNAGKLKTRGVEGDFNFRVPGAEGLNFRGAVAYNDAKYHDYIGQCYPGQTIEAGCSLNFAKGVFNSQDFEGRTPQKAPKFAGRLGSTFDLPLAGAGMNIRFSGDISRTSSYNFTDALRSDATQHGYTKVDASVSLTGANNRWSLSLIGRNLTNQLVVTAANDIPFAGGTGTGTHGPGVLADMSAFIDNPREIFLELGFKY